MRALFAALVLGMAGAAGAAPSVLNASSHADVYIAPAVNAVLGAGKVDNPIFVDYDPAGTLFNIVGDSSNGSGAFKSVATDAPSNHATYAAINASICCYMPSRDQGNYAVLLSQGTVYTQPLALAIGGGLPVGTAPPVVMVSSSSTNSANGGSGWGIEFGLSANYKGLNTSEDSWVSAGMVGLLLALKYNHPTWNWFDIKGALRQTAASWATGYSSSAFGFGTIDWDSANAVSSTGNIFLQGPGLAVANAGYFAVLTLYPYRQTRRQVEAIYSVSSSYVWPVKNEYTAADITASGATLLFTSNGTDVTPTYTFAPAATGTVTFVTFTLDGSGGYSRVEPYTKVSASFTLHSSCPQ